MDEAWWMFKIFMIIIGIGAFYVVAVEPAINRMMTEQWEKSKRRYHGLTCNKCGSIASALAATGNKYYCDNCGRQFSGSRHGF